jgi:hypothetical protein
VGSLARSGGVDIGHSDRVACCCKRATSRCAAAPTGAGDESDRTLRGWDL